MATVSVPEPMVMAPAAPLTVPAVPAVTSAPPAALVPNAPPVLSTAHLFDPTWVPLEAWSQFNGLAKPQRLTAANVPHPTFRVQTTNGFWTLKAGSRVAQRNGLEVWLGFDPRVMWDALYVHTLDAQKNLQALTSVPELITKSNRIIVLDPGHGGHDSGAQKYGTVEKEVVLAFSLKLREKLMATGRYKVLMTRDTDRFIDLDERRAFADREKAALFIAVHAD